MQGSCDNIQDHSTLENSFSLKDISVFNKDMLFLTIIQGLLDEFGKGQATGGNRDGSKMILPM